MQENEFNNVLKRDVEAALENQVKAGRVKCDDVPSTAATIAREITQSFSSYGWDEHLKSLPAPQGQKGIGAAGGGPSRY